MTSPTSSPRVTGVARAPEMGPDAGREINALHAAASDLRHFVSRGTFDHDTFLAHADELLHAANEHAELLARLARAEADSARLAKLAAWLENCGEARLSANVGETTVNEYELEGLVHSSDEDLTAQFDSLNELLDAMPPFVAANPELTVGHVEGFAPDIAGPEECRRCDGCGWYEGGKTLQTTCEECKGTGLIIPARAAAIGGGDDAR